MIQHSRILTRTLRERRTPHEEKSSIPFKGGTGPGQGYLRTDGVTDHGALFREKARYKSSPLMFDVTSTNPPLAELPWPVLGRALGIRGGCSRQGNKIYQHMPPYLQTDPHGLLYVRRLSLYCPRSCQGTGKTERRSGGGLQEATNHGKLFLNRSSGAGDWTTSS